MSLPTRTKSFLFNLSPSNLSENGPDTRKHFPVPIIHFLVAVLDTRPKQSFTRWQYPEKYWIIRYFLVRKASKPTSSKRSARNVIFIRNVARPTWTNRSSLVLAVKWQLEENTAFLQKFRVLLFCYCCAI